ncbi:hypothetical protein [Carp edema virus]|nr:hypothetical protein [Carp edema virus]
MTTSWIVVFVLLPFCFGVQFEYKLNGPEQHIGNLSYKNSDTIWLHIWSLGRYEGSYSVNKTDTKISNELNKWLSNTSIIVFPNLKGKLQDDLINLSQFVSVRKEITVVFVEWSVDKHVHNKKHNNRYVLKRILNESHPLIKTLNEIVDHANILECWGQGVGAIFCMKTQDYQISNYSRIVSFDIVQNELLKNNDITRSSYNSELVRSNRMTNLIKICHTECTENEIKVNQNSGNENYSVPLTFWTSLINGSFAVLSKKDFNITIDYSVQNTTSSWLSQVTDKGIPNHAFTRNNISEVSCEFRNVNKTLYSSFVCYYRVCYMTEKNITNFKTKLTLTCDKSNVVLPRVLDFGTINITSRFTNKSNIWRDSNLTSKIEFLPTTTAQTSVKNIINTKVITPIINTTFVDSLMTTNVIITSNNTDIKNSTNFDSLRNHFNLYIILIISITLFLVVISVILLVKFWNDCCSENIVCIRFKKRCKQNLADPLNEKCENLKDIITYSCYDFSSNWKVEDPEFQNMLNIAKQQYPELYDSRYRIVSEIDHV